MAFLPKPFVDRESKLDILGVASILAGFQLQIGCDTAGCDDGNWCVYVASPSFWHEKSAKRLPFFFMAALLTLLSILDNVCMFFSL